MNRTIFVSRRQTHSLIHCEFMQKKMKIGRKKSTTKQQTATTIRYIIKCVLWGKMKCENILKMILMMIWVWEHGYILVIRIFLVFVYSFGILYSFE